MIISGQTIKVYQSTLRKSPVRVEQRIMVASKTFSFYPECVAWIKKKKEKEKKDMRLHLMEQ